MKTYRVTYRVSDNREDQFARTEHIWADGWRVERDAVLLYQRVGDREVPVWDVPKTRIMRIHEIRRD